MRASDGSTCESSSDAFGYLTGCHSHSHAWQDEVTALTPETAFKSGYLQLEAAAGDDDGDDVPALVVERRRKRRARRQASFAGGDDLAKAAAARVAALTFLEGQP